MSVDASIKQANKVAGIKQATKAVERDLAKQVYVAKDVEPKMLAALIALCKSKGIQVLDTESKFELGRACGLHTDAAAVAVLKNKLS